MTELRCAISPSQLADFASVHAELNADGRIGSVDVVSVCKLLLEELYVLPAAVVPGDSPDSPEKLIPGVLALRRADAVVVLPAREPLDVTDAEL